MRLLVASTLILALAAAPALGQDAPAPVPLVAAPAADPLADLIGQSGAQTNDVEDQAPGPPPPAHKATLLPIPAPAPPEPASAASGYMTTDQAYDLRIKGSIAAAQGLQGPLDGGWTVHGVDGGGLYALQLVDRGLGDGVLEGAWRDVRKPGAVGSTGLIGSLERSGDQLVARFSPHGGAQGAVLTLSPLTSTHWSGTLVEVGASQPVTADREPPPSLPAGYVPQGRGPVIWPARAAPVRVVDRPAACPAARGKKGKALRAAKARCEAKSSGKSKAGKAKSRSKAKAPAKRKKRR